MLSGERSKFLKIASSAPSVAFAIKGVNGSGTVSVGNAQVCHGDFLPICNPIAPPVLPFLLFAAGAIRVFVVSVRIPKFLQGRRQSIARSH
jgi:hypothetical protein